MLEFLGAEVTPCAGATNDLHEADLGRGHSVRVFEFQKLKEESIFKAVLTVVHGKRLVTITVAAMSKPTALTELHRTARAVRDELDLLLRDTDHG